VTPKYLLTPDKCSQLAGKIVLIRELIAKGNNETVEVYDYLFNTLHPLYCKYCEEIGIEPDSFEVLYGKH